MESILSAIRNPPVGRLDEAAALRHLGALLQSGGLQAGDAVVPGAPLHSESPPTGDNALAYYLPPERCDETPRGHAPDRAVVYTLGALLYRDLTGQPPFLGATVREVVQAHLCKRPRDLRKLAHEVSPDAERLVHQMLAKAPEQRPTLAEVRAAVARLAGADASAAPAGAGAAEGGRYALGRKLAEDGDLRLYEAVCAGQPARLRRLSASAEPARAARFLRVARALQGLRHPGLAPVLHVGDCPPEVAFAAPTGEVLEDALRRGPLPRAQGLQIGLDLAGALAALHAAGLVYGAVRPTQVLLPAGPPRAVLLDWDGVQPAGVAAPTRTVAAQATPLSEARYLTPEQCLGESALSVAADVYALAALLWHALAGAPPFPGPTAVAQIEAHKHATPDPMALRSTAGEPVSAELVELLQRGLAKDPAQRPSAVQIEQALRRCCPAVGPTPPPRRTEPLPPAAPVAPAAPAAPAGSGRIGKYQVQGALSQGAAGQVLAAVNTQSQRRVAIKLLARAYAGDAHIVRQFLDEAQAVNRIGAPGIVEIFDCDQLPDGTPYLVMELLDGQPLSDVLDPGGHLREREAVQVGIALSDALASAHSQHVVHRDLRPGNVMLLAPGSAPCCKILNFGMAKVLGAPAAAARTVAAGLRRGDPRYLPPEQLQGSPVTPAADVYALGATLYHALVGRPPRAAAAVPVVLQRGVFPPPPRAGIRRELWSLLLRMLAARPDARPGMVEVGAALRGVALQIDREDAAQVQRRSWRYLLRQAVGCSASGALALIGFTVLTSLLGGTAEPGPGVAVVGLLGVIGAPLILWAGLERWVQGRFGHGLPLGAAGAVAAWNGAGALLLALGVSGSVGPALRRRGDWYLGEADGALPRWHRQVVQGVGAFLERFDLPEEQRELMYATAAPPPPVSAAPSGPVAAPRPRWFHPLAGRRTLPPNASCRFGAPRPGERPAECEMGHCGVDLASSEGTPVHAVADGVVYRAVRDEEQDPRAGRYVMILHRDGTVRTSYIHLDQIRADLRSGMEVRAGEPIGTVGRTGVKESGTHLHFAIALMRQSSARYVDPEPLLASWPLLSPG